MNYFKEISTTDYLLNKDNEDVLSDRSNETSFCDITTISSTTTSSDNNRKTKMESKEDIAKKMKELGHGKAKKIGPGIRVNCSRRVSGGEKTDSSDDDVDTRVVDNNLMFDIERNLPKKEICDQTFTKPVVQNVPKNEFKRTANSKPVFQPQKTN